MSSEQTVEQSNRKLLIKLCLIVVAMFVFAVFILPPIYQVFCELTGLNGKTSNTASSASAVKADKTRSVQVQFLADTDAALPWDFQSRNPVMTVHPGEVITTHFRVKNNAAKSIVARAVPSVAPSEATQHFKKTACFCFLEQRLEAGEEKDMALIFYIDPALPKDIHTITLAYKFYNQTERHRPSQAGN